jgi:hypothetical protein
MENKSNREHQGTFSSISNGLDIMLGFHIPENQRWLHREQGEDLQIQLANNLNKFNRGFHPFLQVKYTLYRSWYPSVKSFRSLPSLNRQVSSCLSSLRSNRGIIEPCRVWSKDVNTIPNDQLVILGIETSCDDTGAAVTDLLVQYGGVSPKMAQEAHARVIDAVVEEALQNANLTPFDLSVVAETIGPGLSLCLRVGVRKAKTVAGKHNLPMVGVHHMETHALVSRLTEKHLLIQHPSGLVVLSKLM